VIVTDGSIVTGNTRAGSFSQPGSTETVMVGAAGSTCRLIEAGPVAPEASFTTGAGIVNLLRPEPSTNATPPSGVSRGVRSGLISSV